MRPRLKPTWDLDSVWCVRYNKWTRGDSTHLHAFCACVRPVCGRHKNRRLKEFRQWRGNLHRTGYVRAFFLDPCHGSGCLSPSCNPGGPRSIPGRFMPRPPLFFFGERLAMGHDSSRVFRCLLCRYHSTNAPHSHTSLLPEGQNGEYWEICE